MAKKKSLEIGSPIGYPSILTDGSPSIYDNNPDGPSNKPTFDLDGTRYPAGKKSFVNNVAAGEGKDRPDVIVQTPNGVSRSQGQNRGQQGNWNADSSWSEDKPWNGANLTGM